MNWGIIGLGFMAKKFANSIKELENSKLIGASSKSFFRLIKFGYKNQINFKYLFKDYKKILSCEEIDNIYICSLNNTHHDLIIKCIEAGKNVLCEKPFVIDNLEAENIKKKLIKTNVFFLEAIAYRSHPQTEKVIELLKENIIGNITEIKSNFGFNAGAPNKKGRLFSKNLGGGSILDLGCYPISMSNLIANFKNKKEEMVPEISEVTGRFYSEGVDLNAKAKLTYDNSITASIEVAIDQNLENFTEICGTHGKIRILEPWLPQNKSVIEIHKNNQIQKFNIESNLSIFANQIKLFDKFANLNQIESDSNAMSLENSMNYLKVMSKWRELLKKNESR